MRWDVTVRQGRQKVSKDALESWTNGPVTIAYQESRNLIFLTMKASFSSSFGFTVMNRRYLKHQIPALVSRWGQQKIVIAKCAAVTSLYPVVSQWFYQVNYKAATGWKPYSMHNRGSQTRWSNEPICLNHPWTYEIISQFRLVLSQVT